MKPIAEKYEKLLYEQLETIEDSMIEFGLSLEEVCAGVVIKHEIIIPLLVDQKKEILEDIKSLYDDFGGCSYEDIEYIINK